MQLHLNIFKWIAQSTAHFLIETLKHGLAKSFDKNEVRAGINGCHLSYITVVYFVQPASRLVLISEFTTSLSSLSYQFKLVVWWNCFTRTNLLINYYLRATLSRALVFYSHFKLAVAEIVDFWSSRYKPITWLYHSFLSFPEKGLNPERLELLSCFGINYQMNTVISILTRHLVSLAV